jgi:hypothetical protein
MPEQEQHEKFKSRITGNTLVQYDYRDSDGNLFSTVKPTLEQCREARDNWLSKN